jgi:hypothetical protein
MIGKVALMVKILRLINIAILSSIAGILFNSCTTETIRFSYHHKKSNEELLHYVDLIQALNTELSLPADGRIGFKKNLESFLFSEQRILGSCNYVLPTMEVEIDISRSLWKSLSYYEKVLLVAHELRHCVCPDFGHKKVTPLFGGCPGHYMNAYSPGFACSKHYFNVYLQQIKSGCKDDK